MKLAYRPMSALHRAAQLSLIVAVAISMATVVNANEPTLREITTQSRERAARASQEKIAIILHRQKDNQLQVYLNSRGGYVNGKSLTTAELSTIVNESELKSATITAEPYLSDERVARWQQVIRKAGITNVDLAAAKKRNFDTDEKLREILHRQKGDELKVYLKNSRGVYVNGKSVSREELKTIIRESGLRQFVVTYEPFLSRGSRDEIGELIRSAGGRDVTVTTRESK